MAVSQFMLGKDVEQVLDRAVQVSEKEIREICTHLKIANPRLGFLKYLVVLCVLQFQKGITSI